MKKLLPLILAALLLWGGPISLGRTEPSRGLTTLATPWPDTLVREEYSLADPAKVARAAPSPTSRPLTLTAEHRNGTVLRLLGIQFEGSQTRIDMLIANGGGQDVQLNFGGKELLLVDTLGNLYMVVPPDGNAEVAVPAGRTVRESLAFSGRIDPEAEALTLITNDRAGEVDGHYSRRPKLQLEIPLSS